MLRQARISAPSSSQGHFSLPQEILGRSDCSESQPLVTNPRYGCSYRAGDGEEITPRAGLGPEERGYGGADCYLELRRIPLPRTPVNKSVRTFATHSSQLVTEIIRLTEVLGDYGCYPFCYLFGARESKDDVVGTSPSPEHRGGL